MTQRIAPNNQLPATHFIEVGIILQYYFGEYFCDEKKPIEELESELEKTIIDGQYKTIAIFRIRPNRIPTKHNFNK